jgi:histidine triad (HIT) family protein
MDHKVDHSVESNVDCLFCKIIAGQIPSKPVYQDNRIYAFADIRPQAPTHLLVLPRKHIRSLAHVDGDDESLLGHLLAVSAQIARKAGLENGYRVVINTGDDGGQTVDHLHLHVLGGRNMHWPPG